MYEALLKATQEYQKIAASFAKPGPAALFGLPPAGRALLYAALQKDLGRVLCIVTPGEAEATHFADDLKALGLAAAVFPPRDFMLRPVEGAGREYEYRRLSVLGALAGGRLQAVCVPAEALLQYTVPRDEFLKNTLTLKPGMVYNREALVARLFAAGYVRRSQVDGPGQFSVRGDIVDIYAPDMRQPARVEYWDDEIDSMGAFDPGTQRRTRNVSSARILPAAEVLPHCAPGGLPGLADQLTALAEKLAARDEERYGPAAQQLRAKADRALMRQREKRQHEKNMRQGKHKPWAAPPSRPSKREEAPPTTSRRERGKGGSGRRPGRPETGTGRAPRTFPGKPGPGGRKLTAKPRSGGRNPAGKP